MNDWSCSSKNAFYIFLERNVIIEVWRELCVPVCCGSPMSFVSESKNSVSLGSQVTQMGWCRIWASWTIWNHGQLHMLKDSVTFQNPCLIFIHGYVSHVCFKVSGKQLGMEGIHWDLVRVLRCCDLLRDVLAQAMRISLVSAPVSQEQPWDENQNLNSCGRWWWAHWTFQDIAAICFLANIIQSVGQAVWSRTKIIRKESSTNSLYFVAFV